MALSTRAVLVVAACLSSLALGIGGCRSLEVCGGDTCGAQSLQTGGDGEGGRPMSSAGVGGSAEPDEQAGVGGAVGEGSGGAAGEGGTPGEGGALQCGPELADCDGSRLTPCETNLSWSVRHCGACGQVCDGLCQNECQPATLVWEGYASSMVANASTGFAVSDYGNDSVLLQIDIQTAQAIVLLNVSSSTLLAMSSDRVYAFDPDSELLHSARVNGTDLKVEAVPEPPLSLGATADGAYYVDYIDAAQDAYRLWFRATGAHSWQQLHAGESLEIVASSAFGLLLSELDETEQKLLSTLHGTSVEPLPQTPAGFSLAAMTSVGPVVLVADSEKAVNELWWLSHDPPLHYEIPWVSSSDGRLNVFSDEVVIYFEDHGTAFIQHFGASGPVIGIGGLPSVGTLVYLDAYDVWYTVWDTPLTRRLLRAKWFDLEP